MWRRNLHDAVICLTVGSLSIGVVVLGFLLRESMLPEVELAASAAAEKPVESTSSRPANRLQFAVAPMIETKATFSVYHRLVQWICQDIGYEPEFVLSSNYTRIRESLENGDTQVAFVCTGTVVHALKTRRLELLAEPVFTPPFEYRCVILVNAAHPAQTVRDLRGSTMAFTDPESFTGNLVPRALLASEGIQPDTFFKKIIYTGSHDRSILAATLSVADAVAVDALVWEAKRLEDTTLNDRVRVLWTSGRFAPPPVVVPASTDPALKTALQNAFLNIHTLPEGRAILAELGIDHFKIPDRQAYEAAAAYLNSGPPVGDVQ